MTLPPTHLELAALELAEIRRRLERLERAMSTPIAWLALEGLAILCDAESPAATYRRLCFAESLLEAAIAWYRPRWIVGGRWPTDRQVPNDCTCDLCTGARRT
jgi:hypothetical protein